MQKRVQPVLGEGVISEGNSGAAEIQSLNDTRRTSFQKAKKLWQARK
jgi:hypothetical protein